MTFDSQLSLHVLSFFQLVNLLGRIRLSFHLINIEETDRSSREREEEA